MRIAELIESYRTDEASTFKRLRFRTRAPIVMLPAPNRTSAKLRKPLRRSPRPSRHKLRSFRTAHSRYLASTTKRPSPKCATA